MGAGCKILVLGYGLVVTGMKISGYKSARYKYLFDYETNNQLIIMRQYRRQGRSQSSSSSSQQSPSTPQQKLSSSPQEVSQQPQAQQLAQQGFVPAENWVNAETRAFINKLSFNGYVLAGNSVTNMAEGIPLQGDLDFWACTPEEYNRALSQIAPFYTNLNMYPSMVEMYNKKGNLPRINLIYTNLTPDQTIQRFDFDYCRYYWTPGHPIQYEDGCQQSIKTKIIAQPCDTRRVMRKRILKALKYGYIFHKSFWAHFPQLLVNQKLIPENSWNNNNPFPIRIDDLNMNKFLMRQIPIKTTNIHDINKTIQQVSKQFKKISKFQNVKLPILLKFQNSDIELIKKYIQCIVMKNPLSDTHYFQIKIGTQFVNCYPEGQYDGVDDSEGSASAELSDDYMQQQQGQLQKKMNSSLKKQERASNSQHPENTKTIIPNTGLPFVIQLNESGTAYISVDYLPKNLYDLGLQTFDKMWKLHPEQKHKIILYEKQFQVCRYSKSYLKTPTDLSHTVKSSYMYSGYNTENNNEDLPEEFKPFYEAIHKKDIRFNQVIANWYKDEQDYIAAHSDCQRGMIQNGSVCLVSLYENDNPDLFRYLEVVPKKGVNSLSGRFIIRLDHGSMITMHGKTQDQFKHEIKKSDKPVAARISLSFRQMI